MKKRILKKKYKELFKYRLLSQEQIEPFNRREIYVFDNHEGASVVEGLGIREVGYIIWNRNSGKFNWAVSYLPRFHNSTQTYKNDKQLWKMILGIYKGWS